MSNNDRGDPIPDPIPVPVPQDDGDDHGGRDGDAIKGNSSVTNPHSTSNSNISGPEDSTDTHDREDETMNGVNGNNSNSINRIEEEPAPAVVPADVLKLWSDVGRGLEINQTVVWVNSVKSLQTAKDYLPVSTKARAFVDMYAFQIISIMLMQVPTDHSEHERRCVEQSLQFGAMLVAVDLEIHNQKFARGDQSDCPTLPILQSIFDRSKVYYRGNRGNQWSHRSVHNAMGRPDVRFVAADWFRAEQGFERLAKYMMDRVGLSKKVSDASAVPSERNPDMVDSSPEAMETDTDLSMEKNDNAVVETKEANEQVDSASETTRTAVEVVKAQFLSWDIIRTILLLLNESLQNSLVLLAAFYPDSPEAVGIRNSTPLNVDRVKGMADAAIFFARAYMQYIMNCSEEELKKIPPEQITKNQKDLQRIFDKLILVRRDATNEFYSYWRQQALTYIQSQSLPLRLLGWSQIDQILVASEAHRPPPRNYVASGAGVAFVDGEYKYNGLITPDGYAYSKLGAYEKTGAMDISYQRIIPDDVQPGGGKKLTLFKCSMRSQHKWWFLSEADEEQPGTDRDIDYYQHKSKPHEERQPPTYGWLICTKAGREPAPKLEAVGLMVPQGEDANTLEHQLAQWAIENEIIELVLGDSVHREIVLRSTKLLNFLASMCERDDPATALNSVTSADFCMKPSHLLLAWNTCTKKTDAAVSAQIYQLLVSILPSCPSKLAIPLLKAIQDSLVQNNSISTGIGKAERQDNLDEVAEFCTALAFGRMSDANGITDVNNGKKPSETLSDNVRTEVLALFWSVFIRPEASSLKSYDTLKQYVTTELKVEPLGKKLREKYLSFCLDSIRQNSKEVEGNVDEVQALRMVRLSSFVLQACPPDQASELVMHDHGALPLLLSDDLSAFLRRRQNSARSNTLIRKASSFDSSAQATSAWLAERLRIIRNVYGMNDNLFMNTLQLNTLWQQCQISTDREEIMVFVDEASATSASSNGNQSSRTDVVIGPSKPNETVSPSAFTAEVSESAFLTLFCSPSISFGSLSERAYKSFISMFEKLKGCEGDFKVTRSAIDALWRICLETKNDAVATKAMNDLLAVYAALHSQSTTDVRGDPMHTDSDDANDRSTEENFGSRVFECLSGVKSKLEAKDPSAELATARCLRILNVSIGQSGSHGFVASSVMARLSRRTTDSNLKNYINKYLPHGMRGQACYRRITIVTRRQIMQGQQVHGQHSFQERDFGRGRSGSSPYRFQVDVHPFETLYSIRTKVSNECKCPITSVRAVSLIGHGPGIMGRVGDTKASGISSLSEDMVADEVGIIAGSEITYIISERQMIQPNINPQNTRALRNSRSLDLSYTFFDDSAFLDKLFYLLLAVLELLPWREDNPCKDSSLTPTGDAHKLVWQLLLAMPTNNAVETQVMFATKRTKLSVESHPNAGAMDVGRQQSTADWATLLDCRTFHRSVYVLLAIDAFLQPAVEVLSFLAPDQSMPYFTKQTVEDASVFRRGFIESGGFDAVVAFVSTSEGKHDMSQGMMRMGNSVALRILKRCVFSDAFYSTEKDQTALSGCDEIGLRLLESLTDAKGFLLSLASMVVADKGVSVATIADALQFLRLLFQSPERAQTFVQLPDKTAEKLVVTLLLWEGIIDPARPVEGVYAHQAATKVRATTRDLVVTTPVLADKALAWLMNAIDGIEVTSESTAQYFDLLGTLISGTTGSDSAESNLEPLATAVCRKLASCRRPSSEAKATGESTTAVLCGCLFLLRSLIENAGGVTLKNGTALLVKEFDVTPWSSEMSPSDPEPGTNDIVLIDFIGVIFDAFLSPGGATSILAICSDTESKSRGFEAISTALRTCEDGHGFRAIVKRVNGLMVAASPSIKHHWGQSSGGNDGTTRHGKKTSEYSGLHNQGCTCYMNSVLQQLFMMPELRKSLCEATLPSSVRSSGRMASTSGNELVGRDIRMQWENGSAYQAKVLEFNSTTGTHVIRYEPVPVASVVQANHHQITQEHIDNVNFPPFLRDEFILSDGRPGKETGVYETLDSDKGSGTTGDHANSATEIEETEDEASSRRLMEEVQRTFIHLEEGSRGRWFDPRSLVEACACLKLEFDVWQQNDASEFATKLLDRLETSLKKWAPDNFKYLEHTFVMKQTKQKICKECGLKSNREEKHLNVICPIRGKADIHEALASLCETEIMEGSNQVTCDNCKKKTDTILRTAISELPNMLILSLKRFDLDYNTFETVKLNSRCAFGQTLNMKRYTLEGVEALENRSQDDQGSDAMDTESDDSALRHIPDEDYEYKLAGVLVHSGVAQGGHYYSFIKDRNPGMSEKWYRFDDEDVTSFDPALIETECFGGKVKKETKWPNGQVNTVESEQFANALMLFYEKVKVKEQPADSEDLPSHKVTNKPEEKGSTETTSMIMSSGYDVFEPDVSRSNATHRWQSFLFDKHFQSFLRGLLGLCKIALPSGDSNTGTPGAQLTEMKAIQGPWRRDVLQMLVSFLFDVYLYGEEKDSILEWRILIETILDADREFARDFVGVLAERSQFVNDNWFRTYLLECPDAESRNFSARVFAKAFCSAASVREESDKLVAWTEAWRGQWKDLHENNEPFPPRLVGASRCYEDLSSPTSSSMGLLLSHLNELIEASTRRWKFNINFAQFTQLVAEGSAGENIKTLKQAIIACLIPARLICFTVRPNVPEICHSLLPACSVDRDIAETQIKQEQHPQPMIPHNQVMLHQPNHNDRGGRSYDDYKPVIYTLAFLYGLPGMSHAEITIEQTDQSRGRQRRVLSPAASNALRQIFSDLCADGAPGMSMRDIEDHLLRYNVQVTRQKIMELMSQYPALNDDGTEPQQHQYLGFDGFLAYYRDVAIDEELRFKNELHDFGFRPDLTRRSTHSMIPREGRNQLTTTESVAIDVAEALFANDVPPSLGALADIGMKTYRLVEMAVNIDEPVFQYLAAAAHIGRESDLVIEAALLNLCRSTAAYRQGGNDAVHVYIKIIQMMASIPDLYQENRIRLIMMSDRTIGDGEPPGLCRTARRLYGASRRGGYPHEVQDMQHLYERHVGIIKELMNIEAVMRWMIDNRVHWEFMHRELLSTSARQQRYHHQQGFVQTRGDYSVRRDADVNLEMPVDDHMQSDSDVNGINESEEDDDDSAANDRYDDEEDDVIANFNDRHFDEISDSCIVRGAGSNVVNGEYGRDEEFDGTLRFSKAATYNGRPAKFSIFRCTVSNNTRHWYISIIPEQHHPGTSSDVDFYTVNAAFEDEQIEYPPRVGWTTAKAGTDPAPTIQFPENNVDPDISQIYNS